MCQSMSALTVFLGKQEYEDVVRNFMTDDLVDLCLITEPPENCDDVLTRDPQRHADVLDAILASELDFLCHIKSSPSLSPFIRREDFWEVLFMILSLRDRNDVGLNQLPNLIGRRKMHDRSVAGFLRERVKAGVLIAEIGDRKDKRVVRVPKSIEDELVRVFCMRLTRLDAELRTRGLDLASIIGTDQRGDGAIGVGVEAACGSVNRGKG